MNPSGTKTFRPANGSQQSYAMPMNNMDRRERETPSNLQSPSPLNPLITKPTSLLIHHLPLNTTEDSLRSMVVWSKEFTDAVVLPHDPHKDGTGFRSAVMHFKSHSGALQARGMLNGAQNVAKDAQMVVEFYWPTGGFAGSESSSSSSTASSGGPTPRQSSHFNGAFQSMQTVSPTNNYARNELPNPEYSNRYQNLFSPQSPIGNHLNERTRISGKSLINNDSVDDDETGELIKDPISWAENGSGLSRRSTLPQLPISHMANLTLTTTSGGGPANQIPGYSTQQAMVSMQAHAGPISPSAMGNGGPPANYQLGSQHYQRHNFPPVNPADQNPPCNTLYVGNLPIDTSEDELKAMFSKQRGYKRLCFRTKQNGPMCFVEFEDVSFATKALHELYGHPLHNSIKGGIRLSFSKNPLGVRTGQTVGNPTPAASNGMMHGLNGMMNGSLVAGSFASANGPPPGLTAPPGLGHTRTPYGGGFMSNMTSPVSNQYAGNGYTTPTANGWIGQPSYPRAMTAGGPPNLMNGGNQAFPPPAYMMGR